MRRYNEPVEVSTASERPCPATVEFDHPGGAGQPTSFVWRGRHYVVREVLSHWRERRAWWRDALDPAPGQPHGVAAAAREGQVWRVEASAGGRSGVFDLACDDPADFGGLDRPHAAGAAGPAPPGWRLVRVAD